MQRLKMTDLYSLVLPNTNTYGPTNKLLADFEQKLLATISNVLDKYEDTNHEHASIMTNDTSQESVGEENYSTASDNTCPNPANTTRYITRQSKRSMEIQAAKANEASKETLPSEQNEEHDEHEDHDDHDDDSHEDICESTSSIPRTNGTNTKSQSNLPSKKTVTKYFTPKSALVKKNQSRIAAPSPSTRQLTDSALKKLKKQETERAALLQQQLQEKERKALLQKEQMLAQKVEMTKKKREEKERKVAKTREQLEKEALEKRMRESAKKKEAEKRRIEIEEAKKAVMKKEEERALAERKAMEEAVRKAAEAEAARRKEEQERVQAQLNSKIAEITTQQKLLNSSNTLHHKALANSFLQKQQQTKENSANTTYTAPNVQQNSTFKIDKVESYDIGDLNSDSENEDEHNSEKPIPSWATGKEFIASLATQYGISKSHRDRKVFKIFRLCPTQVDLEDIFAGFPKIVSSRYDKRTSSAVWASPPGHHLNLSQTFWNDCSFSRSMFEGKETK